MNIDRTLFAAEIKAQNDPFPSSAGFIVSNSMHGSSISTKPFCLHRLRGRGTLQHARRLCLDYLWASRTRTRRLILRRDDVEFEGGDFFPSHPAQRRDISGRGARKDGMKLEVPSLPCTIVGVPVVVHDVREDGTPTIHRLLRPLAPIHVTKGRNGASRGNKPTEDTSFSCMLPSERILGRVHLTCLLQVQASRAVAVELESLKSPKWQGPSLATGLAAGTWARSEVVRIEPLNQIEPTGRYRWR
jgi:hypothetical protein